MKTVLLISSSVSASYVGARVSAFCLNRLGIDTVILPTTLFGRHPGWGAPGGAPVSTDTLRSMWEAIDAQNLTFDAIMSGYMADMGHIDLTAHIIDALGRKNPDMITLIDPVMGDEAPDGTGRLYIDKPRADKIISDLVPRADIITPNAWELSYMTGRPTASHQCVLDALQALPGSRQPHFATLVTSVVYGKDIGALWVKDERAHIVHHPQFPDVPHGGGDSLAAIFLAHIINGLSAEDAMSRAVGAIYDILSHSISENCRELPLPQAQEVLIHPTLLPVIEI